MFDIIPVARAVGKLLHRDQCVDRNEPDDRVGRDFRLQGSSVFGREVKRIADEYVNGRAQVNSGDWAQEVNFPVSHE